MAFNVKLWGVRGSIPSPVTPATLKLKLINWLNEFKSSTQTTDKFVEHLEQSGFLGYGGNTTCIEVFTKNSKIIIDGGSGIRSLGIELLSGPLGQGKGEAHILLTHFHWDHLIGLPFFIPIFIPGNKIHFYSPHHDLEHAMHMLFKKPFFPVEFNNLGAQIIFHKLEPRIPTTIGDFSVSPFRLDHPDPCWGYKIQNGGKTFSHCVDNEGNRVSREELGEDLPLYQGVDLLLFDAQYTVSEIIDKTDWGHSTSTIGLDIALREDVKKIGFMHHDPFANDEKMKRAVDETQNYYNICSKRLNQKIEWFFAREGMTIEV